MMTVIRISQAGGCPRRIALEARGVEGLPISEATKRAFAEGNLHERNILSWAGANLPGAPYEIIRQQEAVAIKDTPIQGHIDGIAVGLDSGEFYLLEAKCLAARSFQELRQRGVKDAQPQYYVQVQLYLHALFQSQHFKRLAGAYLVASNKDTPKSRLWDYHFERIEYDANFAESEVERLCKLAETIDRGSDVPIPEGYHPDTDWHCKPRYCPYTYVCHPDWHRKHPEVVPMDELADTVEQYQFLAEQINELTAARDELRERLLASISPGTTVQAGDYVLSCIERRAERFDTKKARQILSPDVLKELLTVSTSTILKIEEVS